MGNSSGRLWRTRSAVTPLAEMNEPCTLGWRVRSSIASTRPRALRNRGAGRSAQLAAACDIHEDDPEYRYLGEATGASIVVSIPPLRMSHRQQPVPFTIRAAIDDVASVVDLDWQAAAKSEMPPTEFSLQGLPRGIAKLADFYTDRSLLRAVKERMPFLIGLNERTFRVIGAARTKVGRWPAFQVWTAPESAP